MLKTSHSSMDCFRQCPHKYYLSRVVGVLSVLPPRAPSFGSAMHEALNQYHAGLDMVCVIDDWYRAADKWGLDKGDQILGGLLLVAYAERWPPIEGPKAIEARFEHVIDGPDGEPDTDLVMRGYIDVLTMLKVYDHKTTGANLTPSKLAEMAKSPQAIEYILAAPEGVTEAVWDVIKSSKVARRLATPKDKQEFYKTNRKGKWKIGDPKPNTQLEDETWSEYRARIINDIAANPDSYFARVPIRPTEDELDKRRYDIWATSKMMQRAIEDQAFPRFERSCELYGGCEYKPICWEGVDPVTSDLYQIKKRDGRV